MSLIFHVNGEASIMSGSGAGNALEEAGVSVDGVEVEINTKYREVFVDTNGPLIPGDVQYFIQDAIIQADLIWFDWVVLNKWLIGAPGLNVPLGTQAAAGSLLVQQGLTKRLVVRATPQGLAGTAGLTGQESCWNFLNCYLLEPAAIKVGTVCNPLRLRWRAIPGFQPSSTFGLQLWNQSCV